MSKRSELAYDAEAVSLIGSFGDELSAYRARKTWMDVFTNFFLLERERDYDMEIEWDEDLDCFILDCTFSSACGRYAFWRLINHQAPEAEQVLCGTVGDERGSERGFLSSLLGPVTDEIQPSWVIRADHGDGHAEELELERRDTLLGSFFGSINRFFQ